MENKEIEKRIESCIELRKTFWNAFFLLTAGLSTLILNLNSVIKISLLGVGWVAWFLVILVIYEINVNLEALYDKL
jgi:hypothetical protein